MIITAGKYKGQKITAPDENITRPTLSKVRMSVFNILQSMIDFENKSFLDMFAGSGIMGLEAISRGFDNATAIEKNPKAAAIIKSNYKKFNPAPSLIVGDCLKIAPKLTKKFDVIYIDPPYYAGIYDQSLNAVKNIASDMVILEHIKEVDFQEFKLIKQKKYGDKFITFISIS